MEKQEYFSLHNYPFGITTLYMPCLRIRVKGIKEDKAMVVEGK